MEETLRAWKWPITLIIITTALLWVVVVGFGEQLGIHEDARKGAMAVAGFLSTSVFIPIIRWMFRDQDGDGTPDAFQKGKGLVVLLVVLAFAAPSSACSTTALARHTSANGGARVLHQGGVQQVSETIRHDLVETCSSAPDREACVRERALRWEGTETAVNVVAEVIDAWSLALYAWAAKVVREEADPDEPPPGVCELSERAIQQVLAIARDHELVAIDEVTIELGCKPGEGLCESRKLKVVLR
ncbi:MAG: hypothetical protein JJ863_21295 [Deltaproteobacteria bacterium]|nr:hypothetical protein [Deltaproteobacteria bacterium]